MGLLYPRHIREISTEIGKTFGNHTRTSTAADIVEYAGGGATQGIRVVLGGDNKIFVEIDIG